MDHTSADHSPPLIRSGWLEWLPAALAALLGIAVRVRQYAANGALWIDELAVAHNLDDRSLASLLTQPLERNQVAPRGFLLVEKLVNDVSSADLALRAFAFVCSLVAIILFWRLASRLLPAPAAFVAVTLLAIARPVVYYGVQLKPYACDVLASVILLDLAIRLQEGGSSRRLRIGAAGAGVTLVWFAQSAVLVLAGVGFVLTLRALRDGTWRRLLPVTVSWALAAMAATAVGFKSMTPATRAYMHDFWMDGFMPLPVPVAAKSFWPWPSLTALFERSLGYVAPAFFAAAVVAGLLAMCAAYRWGVLVLSPVLIAVAAAAAQQYPFRERLILFLLPNMFLAVGSLVAWIAGRPGRPRTAATWIVAMALVSPAAISFAVKPPPYVTENTKALLAALTPRLQAQDRIYIYYGASSSVSYYASQFGLSDRRYVTGDCHRADTRSYYRELDTFRGDRRVWIVIVHAIATYRERDDILAYLAALGTRREAIIVRSTLAPFPFGAAEAYLYDLSDSMRSRSISAATFPVRGPQRLARGAGCSGSQEPVRRPPNNGLAPSHI